MQEDLVIRFHKQLCDIVNNADLPISIAYFVLKDVYNEVEKIYNKHVQDQTQLLLSPEKTESMNIDIPIDNTEIKTELEKIVNTRGEKE